MADAADWWDRAEHGRAWPAISPLGILMAGLFVAASLTPSLQPRDPLMQGLLCGVIAAIGHELGGFVQWLWRFMQLPMPPRGWKLGLRLLAAAVALAAIGFALSRAADWQNATRSIMGLEPVRSAFPATVAGLALAIALVLWALARLFAIALARAERALERVLPPRVSRVVGLVLVVALFWALIDGALVRWAFEVADASFEAADVRIEPGIPQPDDPRKTGSPASLVKWEEMGRWGRSYVATAPDRAEIAGFSGDGAMDPVRVYVGRAAAETPRERAELALRELVRVGGFARSALVVMVPTGTGWMDPDGQDSLEFILGGDVATVAVQYSYLTSVLSLLAHPEYCVDQSRELFEVVYAYWTKLPKDHRPNLYVHGLSQGAFCSQRTLPLLDILADPIRGALWAGSPFFSPIWQRVREGRQPGSPAWRPQFGNGSLVRVMTQWGGLDGAAAPWGPIRLVLLNYGSDPIVYFNASSAFRKPNWLDRPRAEDVSPALRWFPLVTTFQLALDTMIALQVPGFGHYYAAPDYIDAWAAVLNPPGWTPARAAALKAAFAMRSPAP